eukprot:204752-Prymnesium_polylepis.1
MLAASRGSGSGRKAKPAHACGPESVCTNNSLVLHNTRFVTKSIFKTATGLLPDETDWGE